MSQADKDAAAALRTIWNHRAKQLGLTQEKLAHDWDVTQGLISQYINAHTPLGVVATLRFAKVLKVRPNEIRKDFEYTDTLASELTPEAIEIASLWMALPKNLRADLKRTIQTMSKYEYESFLEKVQKQKESRREKVTDR